VIKGDLRMVKVLRAAVRDQQRAPRRDLALQVDGVPITVPADLVERARIRARGMRRPHNVARKLFVTELLDAIARAEAVALGRSLDDDDFPYARARLWDEDVVRSALDELWPFLTPQRLLAALLEEEGALRRAASAFSSDERSVLLRAHQRGTWTVSDVPLLDEAAELLGADDSADRALRRAAERERREEEEYAQGVLELTGLAGQGLVDAATIAGRNRDEGPELTTAERAAADRSWSYGHVIVDEAQELSAMAWRMVMRRIPGKSLTVVGDVAQTGNPAGARSWGEMLDRYVEGRWREERLTVNYRTPAEIMAVAADVLASVAPEEEPPESVREEGERPRAVRVTAAGDFGPQVARVVDEEVSGLTAAEEGRLAVIAPADRIAELAAQVPGAVPGDQAEALDSPVALLTVAQAKGLEFDRVVLADPAGIMAQSRQGGHDLYVAITRATHRLAVVYDGELPPVLDSLRPTIEDPTPVG
jgi:DNA helicase IV